MVTEAEVDYIYDLDKIMFDDFKWERMASRFEGEASVVCAGEDYDLTVIGWISTVVPEKFQFSLQYQNSITVRRWDNKEAHTNPDGNRINGTHKHKWSESYNDMVSYPVSDIKLDDPMQGIADFLDECSIEQKGDIKPIQTGLDSNGWM